MLFFETSSLVARVDRVRLWGLLVFLAGCGNVAPLPPDTSDVVAVTIGADAMDVCVGGGSRVGIGIAIVREGSFKGDVPIAIDGPTWVSINQTTIPAASTEVVLVLWIDANAPMGSHVVGILAGTSRIEVTVEVGPYGGALDTTYGDAGIASHGFGDTSEARAQIVAQGSKVVASIGNPGLSSPHLIRFDETGAIDPTFLLKGNPFTSTIYALGKRANGTLLAATTPGSGCVSFTEISPDGDVGFSASTGSCAQPMVTTNPACIIEQPDKSVLIAGEFSDCCGFATRFLPGGAVDTTYKPGADYLNSIYSCALARDGTFVLGSYQGIVGIAPDGSRAFDQLTHAQIPTTPNFGALTFANDGTIIAGVWSGPPTSYAMTTSPAVDRLESDGTIKTNTPLPNAPIAVLTERDDDLVLLTSKELSRVTPTPTGYRIDGTFATSAIDNAWSYTGISPATMTTDACGRLLVASVTDDGTLEVRRFWP